MSLPVKSVRVTTAVFRGCGGPHLWLGCGRAELTASDQSRDSGHSRESETSEPETVYDCIKSDLQVCVMCCQGWSPGLCAGQAPGAAPAPGGQEGSPECEVSSLPQQQVRRGQEVQPQHQEKRLAVRQVRAGETGRRLVIIHFNFYPDFVILRVIA